MANEDYCYGVEILYYDGSKKRWEYIPLTFAQEIYAQATKESASNDFFTIVTFLTLGKGF